MHIFAAIAYLLWEHPGRHWQSPWQSQRGQELEMRHIGQKHRGVMLKRRKLAQ